MNFFFSLSVPFTAPTQDKKLAKPQIPFSRTPSKHNTLEDDVTKPESKNVSVITKRMNVNEDDLFCPNEREAKFELFPVICNSNQDCEKVGSHFRCCKLFGSQRCHEGLEKPLEDIDHERKLSWIHSPVNARFSNESETKIYFPALFGIPRKCPKDPLAESFWDVKMCDQDKDCDFPRICCPNGRKRYCMAGYTEPGELPVGRQIAYPVESLSQYFQCTPPPPTAFDKYPKPCNSSLTCFPNICCLEGGRKHCRPPKRNILAALTSFGQRFTNVGWLRDFTDNLVIRK